MLQAWLPPRWAFAGGLLAAFQLVFFGRAHAIGLPAYWSQSYWGGAVAALGGALLFGALRRLVRRPCFSHAFLLGMGLVILANSRPFEGLVISLPAALLLVVWLIQNRRMLGTRMITQVLAPILLVVLPAGAAMLWYDFRVTGDPLRMPYVEHENQYAIAPNFIWQPLLPEPSYRHEALRELHVGYALIAYQPQRSLSGWFIVAIAKAKLVISFFIGGVVLLIPWLALAWIARDRWMRFALVTWGVLGMALLMETYTLAHYVAPATSLFFALAMQGMRHVRLWCWRGRPLGRALIAVVPAVCLATLAFSLKTESFRGNLNSEPQQRANIDAQLCGDGSKHLIIVRYGSQPTYDCWVYNAADIDCSPVVWARQMDAKQNRRLLSYYADRKVWLLDTDSQPARIVPYAEHYESDSVVSSR
jgi:hypothetical protein